MIYSSLRTRVGANVRNSHFHQNHNVFSSLKRHPRSSVKLDKLKLEIWVNIKKKTVSTNLLAFLSVDVIKKKLLRRKHTRNALEKNTKQIYFWSDEENRNNFIVWTIYNKTIYKKKNYGHISACEVDHCEVNETALDYHMKFGKETIIIKNASKRSLILCNLW